MGNASSNSLQPYGLGFGQLNTLEEYGLIISDYDSYKDYRPSVAHEKNVALPLIYQKARWALVPKLQRQISQEFKVVGVAMARSGKELVSNVDAETDEKDTLELKNFFDRQGMMMTAVG